ncbi:MAG TPA: hypothetical protein VK932_05200 [Kofleriaceae bacterium]|nr:hypothetical protein [Kofleriaceae bacterium]
MSRSLCLVPVLAVLTAFALPACSASEASAPPPVAPAQAEAEARSGNNPGARATCVDVFTRNRTCTAQYIPALVDLRAKYDQPPGIAAEVAADRANVIAQANEEWAVDSTPEAIDATCTKIAASLSPGDQADLGGVQACLAIGDCAAYTACVMPYFEKRFAK